MGKERRRRLLRELDEMAKREAESKVQTSSTEVSPGMSPSREELFNNTMPEAMLSQGAVSIGSTSFQTGPCNSPSILLQRPRRSSVTKNKLAYRRTSVVSDSRSTTVRMSEMPDTIILKEIARISRLLKPRTG